METPQISHNIFLSCKKNISCILFYGWALTKNIYSFISENTMEVDKNAASINPNTLQNAHGNYPVWMSQKKQRQLRLKAKKAKKKAKNAKR